ncbi:MAG: ABC transporter substrate-binding protein [Actinobacteria bacterium]|nr:ABC transporter substrate-binding protein [Actinomycetota bacterium]
MQTSTWSRRAAAALAVALLAAGCSTGGETPGDDAGTGTDASVAPPDEPGGDPTPEGDPTGEADGRLALGYVLPESGPLAFLGPPQIAGIDLAIEDINAAGGVLGEDVTLSAGDEAGDPVVASQTAQRLVDEGVDAIVGAASSGMSLALIDGVTNAGVAQCSASNTSPTFTDYSDNGLYFRTAPSDALHGPVLARTIVDDGHRDVAILARADDYGQGLMTATRDALEQQGASVVAAIVYDPEAASFTSEATQVVNAGADAVALISFAEGAEIITALIEAGAGPDDIGVYGADGLRSNELADLVDPTDPSVLEGMRGTAPAGDVSEDLVQRLRGSSELEDTSYAAHAYDCTVMLALAAVAAGSDAGRDLAAQMVAISRDGTKCTSFRECKGLLERDEDVDYDGASGSVDLLPQGEPETGTYEVWTIDGEGDVRTDRTVEVGSD